MNLLHVEMPAPAGEVENVGIDTLIEDLLGVDPALLASRHTGDRMNGAALYGVQAFMRRVLELVVQLREMPEGTLHLKSEKTAERHGWPNAHIANIAIMFVWSVIREDRWSTGLPFVRLEAARSLKLDPPIAIDQALRDMSIDELVTLYRRMPTGSWSGKALPEETFPIAVSALVRSHLGLEPATLTRGFRGTEVDTEALFQGQPESRALVGLNCLMSAVVNEYRVMRARDTCHLRLKSDADAEIAERPSPRAARLITLLAAAMHADDRHDIVFLPARTRSVEDYANLRAVAKIVYLDYTLEALDGLELLCDSNIHFGWPIARSLAKKLLGEVARDCPDAEVPYVVQLQQWGDEMATRFRGDGEEQDALH